MASHTSSGKVCMFLIHRFSCSSSRLSQFFLWSQPCWHSSTCLTDFNARGFRPWVLAVCNSLPRTVLASPYWQAHTDTHTHTHRERDRERETVIQTTVCISRGAAFSSAGAAEPGAAFRAAYKHIYWHQWSLSCGVDSLPYSHTARMNCWWLWWHTVATEICNTKRTFLYKNSLFRLRKPKLHYFL